jgi:prefoldin subunit 5
METNTLINVVAMIDARIAELNKDMKAINASSYSVLHKRQILDRLDGASQALERLSEQLQKAIDADVSAMETGMGM